jgi:hypothetical protein
MAFSTAVSKHANIVQGDNGALKLKTSGSSFVDAFTNLGRDSTPEYINTAIDNMIREVEHISDPSEKSLAALNVWRLWVHKRHCREGEKEKLLSYRYFLILYGMYPKTCCDLVTAGIFGDIGYWKDGLLIWKMIQDIDIPTKSKYDKYNRLIEAIRESMLTQRTDDLKALSDYVSPNNLHNMDVNSIREFKSSSSKESPNVSRVGEWCIREKSPVNKTLCWYVIADDGKLIVQSHVSYMIRASLMKKIGAVTSPWPANEGVPFGAKKVWRKMNSLINEYLEITETRMASNNWELLNPEAVPAVCTSKNIKALLNEKVKTGPQPHEEDTGNRHPDDTSRVDLRKRTRLMFKNPEKINAGALFPHRIAYSAMKSTSTADGEYHQAAWEKKIIDTKAQFEDTRAKIGDEVSQIAAAMAQGNIVGCADVSPSMTWVGEKPEQPIDVAMGLTCFISCVASDKFKDIAFSFTSNPYCFSFKNPGGVPMTVAERMREISSHSGASTNYVGLHTAILDLCVKNKIPENELPVLWIGTDGEFDTMGSDLSSGKVYNNLTCKYDYPGNMSPEKRWETLHECIEKMYVAKGYKKVPLIVYHNLASNSNGVQVDKNYKGVILLAGRSESVLKYILYGEAAEQETKTIVVDGVDVEVSTSSITPYDIFLKAMDGDHFKKMEDIVRASNEGICNYID